MKIISNKSKLVKFVNNGKNLGFVPTMGAIHLGHISMIRKCISQSDKTIVSIFVNKPQFNKQIDFQQYPRVLKKDISILKNLKIDCLYLPKKIQIYPNGVNKNITISSFKKKLCGKFRTGHFEAVADVIDRFIKIIKPKKIYFGEKDMQQLKIMEHFINKNHYKTKVVKCKTIREKDGLAMSSRNERLSANSRKSAIFIYKTLLEAKEQYKTKNASEVEQWVTNQFLKNNVFKLEYVSIADAKTLKPAVNKLKNQECRIFIAAFIDKIRLIDNIALN